MDDLPVAAEEEDTVAERFGGSRRVVDRESDYSKRRFNRTLSPTRDEGKTTYAERVREAQLDRERDNTMRQIAQKQREEAKVAREAAWEKEERDYVAAESFDDLTDAEAREMVKDEV